jgi:mRNA interferase RelE/StbE
MEVIADKSFEKDFKKLAAPIKSEVTKVYNVFLASGQLKITSLNQVTVIVKHKGFYRFKLGDYRIGFYFKGKVLHLSRVLHRKEIYRFFPPG